MAEPGAYHVAHGQRAVCNGARTCKRSLGSRGLASTLMLVLACVTPAANAGCSLGRLAELQVTMVGLVPTVHAKINGADALFIPDSGAFFSLLSPAAAAEFKLRLEPTPAAIIVEGVGGEARTWLTHVKTFSIFGTDFYDIPFFVAGNDLGARTVGLLGQNVFRIADVEYDLANGAIRLMRPHDCNKASLAYWATAADTAYSVMDIEPATAEFPHTAGSVYVNDKKIRAVFDTGADASMISPAAAKRAGVAMDSAGVVANGEAVGLGRRTVRTWVAPFRSFKIGDEEVQNTRLRIGEMGGANVDMLIGADFFLSHRVYVASSQGKLYFTYNGGPVFNLNASAAAATGAAGAPLAAATADAQTAVGAVGNPTTDAAGFSRRGAAYAARHDYPHAIADLSRACELAPTEASYFYQRGQAHLENKQDDLAAADFDTALKLNPDDVPSLIARAQLHANRGATSAVSDLDAADRAAPRESEVRVDLGDLYLQAGRPEAAVSQYTMWIDAHRRDDVHMANALSSRCWARVLWGQQLEQALADCNTALKSKPDSPSLLDSRALVYLRRAEFDRAIADYDNALRMRPKMAWSHYGRGLAKLHKGHTADGRADLAAASALDPDIAVRAGKYGLSP